MRMKLEHKLGLIYLFFFFLDKTIVEIIITLKYQVRTVIIDTPKTVSDYCFRIDRQKDVFINLIFTSIHFTAMEI